MQNDSNLSYCKWWREVWVPRFEEHRSYSRRARNAWYQLIVGGHGPRVSSELLVSTLLALVTALWLVVAPFVHPYVILFAGMLLCVCIILRDQAGFLFDCSQFLGSFAEFVRTLLPIVRVISMPVIRATV